MAALWRGSPGNCPVEPEHESCSERALACQLTRPVIYPLSFLSYCFSGHTDTRLPAHFQKGVAITSISTGQTALPRALGGTTPRPTEVALHASRSRRQHDTRGAQGRFYSHEGPWGLPSEWSTTQACHPFVPLSSSSLCNGSVCPVPAPPVRSGTTDSPWFHRFSAGEEFGLKMNRTSHLI